MHTKLAAAAAAAAQTVKFDRGHFIVPMVTSASSVEEAGGVVGGQRTPTAARHFRE